MTMAYRSFVSHLAFIVFFVIIANIEIVVYAKGRQDDPTAHPSNINSVNPDPESPTLSLEMLVRNKDEKIAFEIDRLHIQSENVLKASDACVLNGDEKELVKYKEQVKRYVNFLLDKLNDKVDVTDFSMTLRVDSKHRETFTKFDAIEDVMSALEAIVVDVRPTRLPDLEWFSEYKNFTLTLLQICCIIFTVLMIMLIMKQFWLYLGLWNFSLVLILLIFWVSVPWTWIHLYKVKLAERFQDSVEVECDPKSFTWYDILFNNVGERCPRKLRNQLIDPLWEVKPTEAIAITVVELFWNPLKIMGEPLAVFMNAFMEPLPWFLKPIAPFFAIFLVCYLVTLISGRRISSWFFTIEPAITAQSQLCDMDRTILEVRAMVQELKDVQSDSANKLNTSLERVESLSSPMTEMLPVLDRICADYAQRQNTVLRSSDVSPAKSLTFDEGPSAKSKEGTRRFTSLFGIVSVDHLVLTTSNADTIIEFYEKLGMEKRLFKGNRAALHFADTKINIHILGNEFSPHAGKPTPGSIDICLVCACDVQTTQNHLKKIGVKIEEGPCERTGACGMMTSVYVRDPDRNLIELAHYSSRESAGGKHTEMIGAAVNM